MFSSKLSTSRQAFFSSLQVVRKNPRLIMFPVIIFICSLVIALFFIGLVVLQPTGFPATSAAHWKALAETWKAQSEHPTAHFRDYYYAYGVAIYVVSMLTATFFNVAFYHEILRALAGETVSIAGGLRFASTRIRSIVAWSLFASLVGWLIQLLSERLGWVGNLVLKMFGMAWSVASVFVIPVIIREGNVNPVTLLRDSTSTVKKTWGESLLGYVGITVVGFGLVVISLIAAVVTGGLVSVAAHNEWFFLGALGLWLVGLLVIACASSIAGHVYRCALYVYATEGVVPGNFPPALMDAGWKVKKR